MYYAINNSLFTYENKTMSLINLIEILINLIEIGNPKENII